ncbi:MAG: hypothetical protein OHK0046_43550 [Anaerolineae bacterium]
MSKERLGLLFVLVGPGGVGKNALLNMVVNDFAHLRQLPTATTRAIRPGEQQGREHLFVSVADFEKMIAENALLEYQEVHPGKFYGVPRATVDDAISEQRDLIADIEVFGAAIIREEYPNNSVTIFIAPPSTDQLVERLKNRQASPQDIQDRVNRLPMEMRYAPLARYIIVNDDMHKAAEELRGIIRIESGEALPSDSQYPISTVSFSVAIAPLYEGQRLVRQGTEEAYIQARFNAGQSPEDAALNTLTAALGIEPERIRLDYGTVDSTIPVVCEYNAQAHTYKLTYSYLYHLPERITPSGWEYIENM